MQFVSLGESAIQTVEGWLLDVPSMRRGASPSREALHRAHAQKQLRCGFR
jgi:hypothetical protein